MILVNAMHTSDGTISHSGSMSSSSCSMSIDSNPNPVSSTLLQASTTAWNPNNSKSTSTLPKTEMLEQLTTNVLPPYVPPPFPPALQENGPCETYPCMACGDAFVLKSSLTCHIQRRSILIRFNCDSCATLQAFYNRCALLCHIRAHKDKGEPSDVSKALVLPLPRVLMEGMQTDVMQNLEDEDDEDISHSGVEAPTPSALLEVSISEGETKIDLSTSSEAPQATNTKHIQCSECSAEFLNAEERKNHFGNKGLLPTVISPCPKCGIICPSKCGTKAHKRLHLQISPYVCPECGDNPDRYWENFQRHLTYQCFHYARSLSYKCSLCQKLFTSSFLLKQHSVSTHIVILYKCHMCAMAFTNCTNFQVHKRKFHAEELLSGSFTDALQMYQCSLCQVVFVSKEDSDAHWDSHLTENICRYAYKCSECSKVLDSKLNLREHLKYFHTELFNKHIAFLNLPHEVSATKGSGRDVGLSKLRIECLLCHGAFMTRQGHSLHVTKSHSNHKYPCGVCNRTSANRLEMISHGKEHLRENVSLCLLCQNKPMKPSDSLGMHLLHHVERVKYQTFCPICETAIFTFAEALQHLRMEHLLPTTDGHKNFQASTSAAVHKGEKENFPLSSGPGDKRSPATPNAIASSSGTMKQNIGPGKVPRNGEKCCAKCNFTSMVKNEFKEHILTHKEKKSTFQCQECGYCYVTERTLKMHLRATHKIIQVDQYVAEEGTNHSPESEAVPEMAKSNDLECSVCFEVFATDALLKTHMRSHGMAFIQAKKNSAN